MAYKRVEIPAAELERQREICAKIREGLGGARPLAFVDTYGCQQNEADSETIRGYIELMGFGFTEDENEADLIVVNTCAVRSHAEMRVLGNVGALIHAKAKNPRLIVAVCGCMVQQPHMAEKIKNSFRVVDLCFGPHELWRFPELYERTLSRKGRVFEVSPCEGVVAEGLPVHRQGSVKAWLSVMYGCNNFCTYCIVPYVRGRERSRLPEDIVREVEEAVKNGYEEVTLLGQNVNSYGKDHKLADFADLLKMVDKVPGIRRVRFMTSHPKDLSDKVIAAIRDGEHLCEHIHLPVQYGSNRILKAMNRVYTVESYRDLVRRIRAAIPDVSLTTDLIVGFPGETDEDFQQMLDFLREIRYDSAYTFIYSKRSGTPAATMENQVDESVKKERLNALMAVQNEISLAINEKLLGKTLEIMVEGPSKNEPSVWMGRTRTNKIVLFAHAGEKPGDFIDVRITHPQTWVLKGERVS